MRQITFCLTLNDHEKPFVTSLLSASARLPAQFDNPRVFCALSSGWVWRLFRRRPSSVYHCHALPHSNQYCSDFSTLAQHLVERMRHHCQDWLWLMWVGDTYSSSAETNVVSRLADISTTVLWKRSGSWWTCKHRSDNVLIPWSFSFTSSEDAFFYTFCFTLAPIFPTYLAAKSL